MQLLVMLLDFLPPVHVHSHNIHEIGVFCQQSGVFRDRVLIPERHVMLHSASDRRLKFLDSFRFVYIRCLRLHIFLSPANYVSLHAVKQ